MIGRDGIKPEAAPMRPCLPLMGNKCTWQAVCVVCALGRASLAAIECHGMVTRRDTVKSVCVLGVLLFAQAEEVQR